MRIACLTLPAKDTIGYNEILANHLVACGLEGTLGWIGENIPSVSKAD